jgi:hypothetical protein
MSDAQEPLLPHSEKEDRGEIDPKSLTTAASSTRRDRGFRNRLAVAFLAAAVPAAVLCFYVWCTSSPFTAGNNALVPCPCTDALPIKAPRISMSHPRVRWGHTDRSDPWKNLDLEEATALRHWLMVPEQGLNLTWYDQARDK